MKSSPLSAFGTDLQYRIHGTSLTSSSFLYTHGAAEALSDQEPHDMGKPNTWQYSMDLGESENIHGNPRLQHPIVSLKSLLSPVVLV